MSSAIEKTLSAVLVAFGLVASVGPALGQASGEREEVIRIPRTGTQGGLLTRLCIPKSAGPHRLAVYNHGRSGKKRVRRKIRPYRCGLMTHTFTSRGYLVAIPVRKGYGKSGGADREQGCGRNNFVRAANAGADDVQAVIRFLRKSKQVVAHNTVVVGQSVGGLVTLALAARNPKGVPAYINFAGGHGAKGKGARKTLCSRSRLLAAFRTFGRRAKKPTLWIYTGNDYSFGPKVSRKMHAAFTKVGGKAKFVLIPKFTNFNVYDGHKTILWGRGREALGTYRGWLAKGSRDFQLGTLERVMSVRPHVIEGRRSPDAGKAGRDCGFELGDKIFVASHGY